MEYDYKLDVINTRKGNLGSSDAKMLQNIAELGYVPKSAHRRLAVVKGLIENPDFTNPAMRFGDYIENEVYNHLLSTDSRWESNPCIVSKKYSRKNVGCLTHVDFMLRDDEKKVITIAECKATKYNYAQTRDEYLWQIYHHYLLATEMAAELGKEYSVRVLLCHYSTDGLDVECEPQFDQERLTVGRITFTKKFVIPYELEKAMDIVDAFLETFDEFYDGDEIGYEYLPENVQKQFDIISTTLQEIKERERSVNEFKERLYKFLDEKGIKSIKSDTFSVTLVAPSEAVSIDYKTLFAQEIESKKPRTARKLKEKYKKVTKRSGFVKIQLKDNNE